jgi:hypothetical protein
MRMTAHALDLAAARLEQIRAEEESLRSELQWQVQEFRFTPPYADKSKRLLGIFYQFTFTVGLSTEIKVLPLAPDCYRDFCEPFFRHFCSLFSCCIECLAKLQLIHLWTSILIWLSAGRGR